MSGKRKDLIRVGVIGVGRGQTFMQQAPVAGMKLVAICDLWKERLREIGKKYAIATYTDYDKFLEHDLDAVVLANYFHQHAPFAIKALKAGKHVMSECAACNTMAEGVELCRTVEETGKIYMFAENYPYNPVNIEMARLYKTGEIGEVLYAEGEYIHPMSEKDVASISPGRLHWRNRSAATYYCTHSLAPLMVITDTMPAAVNAFAIRQPESDHHHYLNRGRDYGSVIICQMDSGAVFRSAHGIIPGHSVWYRLHGTRGLMEHTRGPGYWGPGQLRIEHEPWELRKGEVSEKTYKPDFPAWAREAERAGHGGGDFFTNHYFAEAIRTKKQPYLNVYRGVAMSCVGIQAWRSVLQKGAQYPLPDFTDKTARQAYAGDHWTPYNLDDPAKPPFDSSGLLRSDPQGLKLAKKVWKSIGYRGE